MALSRVGQLVAPVELIMTDFEQHRKDDDEWFSPPFYTNPNGYKMCLKVAANGWAEGKGTHISVYVHTMRGEFDEQLKWPFRRDITVQMLNWEEPYARTISFDDTTVDFTASRVMYGERAEIGQGFCRFASHFDIQSKYLKKWLPENICPSCVISGSIASSQPVLSVSVMCYMLYPNPHPTYYYYINTDR